MVARPADVVLGSEAGRRDPGHLLDAEEVEQRPGDLLRVCDQILIPDAVAAVGVLLLELDDWPGPLQPAHRHCGDAVPHAGREVLVEPVAPQPPRAGFDRGNNHIQAVPVQADELGVRVQVCEQVGHPDVVQGLVAPAPLAAPGQIAAVDVAEYAADRIGRGTRHAGRDLAWPEVVARHLRCGFQQIPHPGQGETRRAQAGLRRAAQLRMTVHDEAQQGGPGPGHRQNDHRAGPGPARPGGGDAGRNVHLVSLACCGRARPAGGLGERRICR